MSLRRDACRAADDAAALRDTKALLAEIARVKELEQKVTKRVAEVLGKPPWLGNATPTKHRVTVSTGRYKHDEEYEALRFQRDGLVFKGVLYPRVYSFRYSGGHDARPERVVLYVETWEPTMWHAITGKKQVWRRVSSLAELGEILREQKECP